MSYYPCLVKANCLWVFFMIGIGEKKIDPSQCFSNKKGQKNHLKGLLKHRFGGLTSRVSGLVYQEWDPRICIFNKFVGDAAAADPGAIL